MIDCFTRRIYSLLRDNWNLRHHPGIEGSLLWFWGPLPIPFSHLSRSGSNKFITIGGSLYPLNNWLTTSFFFYVQLAIVQYIIQINDFWWNCFGIPRTLWTYGRLWISLLGYYDQCFCWAICTGNSLELQLSKEQDPWKWQSPLSPFLVFTPSFIQGDLFFFLTKLLSHANN